MPVFFLRTYTQRDPGSVQLTTPKADIVNSATGTLDSLFDLRFMVEFYIMPPAYWPDPKPDKYGINATGIPLGSPLVAETFIIQENPVGNYVGYLDGAFGDPSRKFILYANSTYITVGDERPFIDVPWNQYGYTDAYDDFDTFKGEVISQINGAIQLSENLSQEENWNVFIYRYRPARTMVWFWQGNDPNADDIIII